MVFRMLLHLLSNNEQLVQRLSESYPVRRAAQMVVLFFHKGKGLVEDKKISPEQFRTLIRKFAQNIQDELKQLKEMPKKRN